MRGLLGLLLVVVLALLGPAGCAALLRDSSASVVVRCNVAGAQLRVDGQPVVAGVVRMRRGEVHEVVAEAPGHLASSAFVGRRVAWGWFVLDLVLWWGVGNVVDLVHGGGWDPDLEVVTLTLAPERLGPESVDGPGRGGGGARVRLSADSSAGAPSAPGSYCSGCGGRLDGAARFCPSCGARR